MKKTSFLFSLLMAIVMMAVCPMNVWAQYDGTPVKPEGDGSKANPYQIGTAAHLYWFSGKVNGTLQNEEAQANAWAVLTADIVVNPGTFANNGSYTAKNGESIITWVPIGNYNRDTYKGSQYTGTFDGCGHTVSGLHISNTNYVYDQLPGKHYYLGLFGITSWGGTIKNVGVINSYFAGLYYIGGILGSAGDGSTIINCYSEAKLYNPQIIANNSFAITNVGGICGYSAATIKNCMFAGYINSNSQGVGGIVGKTVATKIINNVNIGSVNAKCNVGSIIGYNFGRTTFQGNYYLKNTAKDYTNKVQNGQGNAVGGRTTDDGNTGKFYAIDDARFATGEITYMLNGSQSAGTWHQKLGTDTYPVFKEAAGNTLYAYYADCNATKTTLTNSNDYKAHPAQGHKTEKVEAFAPTCTEAGRIDDKCIYCGNVLSSTDIPALGHTPAALEAVAATCTTTGITEGSKCTTCGEILTAQMETPALGHLFTNYNTIVSPSTCEGEGSTMATCDHEGCNEVDYHGIAATGHDWQKTGVQKEATCLFNRIDIYTCQNDGCGKTKTVTVEGSRTGHTNELVAAVAPTCTETGMEAHYHCTVCNAHLKTDDRFGYNYGEYYYVVDPLGHKWANLKDVGTHYGKYDFEKGELIEFDVECISEATCTEPAHYHTYCSRCLITNNESDVPFGKPLGHMYVITDLSDVDLSKDVEMGTFNLKCINDGCTSVQNDINISALDRGVMEIELKEVFEQPTCQPGSGEFSLSYLIWGQEATERGNYWASETFQAVMPPVDGAHAYDANGDCPYHNDAHACALIETYDNEGALESTHGYTQLADAIRELYNGETLKLLADGVYSDDMDFYSKDDVTIDLNGHTLNAAEYRLDTNGSLTFKNGTVNVEVSNANVGSDKKLTLENATLNSHELQWMPNGLVEIKNGSTLNLSKDDGNGRFIFSDCSIDPESRVVLTGISSLGTYAPVEGGYRDIMHRITVPAGYILRQPYATDKNLSFFADGDNENAASMQGVTVTINGDQPFTECNYNNYVATEMYNGATEARWTDYLLSCAICYDAGEGGIVSHDDGVTHVCEDFTLVDNQPYRIGVDFTADTFNYNRTVTGGNIVTFILPAAVPTSAVNGKVWKYRTYNDAEGKFMFDEYTEDNIEPNVPYLVELDGDATMLLDANLTDVAVSAKPDEYGFIALNGEDGDSKHLGTYDSKSIATNVSAIYYGYSKASQKFVKANTGTLNPFRTMFAISNPDAVVYDFADWTSKNQGQNSTTDTSLDGDYTFTAKAGDVISFDWKVSSESSFDKLYAYLYPGTPTEDNYMEYGYLIEASGEESGTREETIDEAGTYTLVFAYAKDGSDYSGDDTAWITNVKHITLGSGASSAKTMVALQLGDTDGIIMVDADAVMGAGSPIYNLQGQRVSKSTKGIVIMNGKKVLNK